MSEMEGDRQLQVRVEQLHRELERVKARLLALERGGVPRRPAAPDPAGRAAAAAAPADTGASLGGMSALFGRAAVACFLLVVALVLRTLADSQLLSVGHGIRLGLGYAVLLNAVGWALLRHRAGQASTFCLTGGVLLGTVLLEGVFRHHAVPLPLAYGLLTGVAVGTGWALRQRTAAAILWASGLVLLATGGALLGAHPPWPWPVALALVANAMAGRSDAGPGRTLFHAVAWLALVGLWGAWGVLLSAALRSGAPVPEHLAPTWFPGMLLATVLYFLGSSVREVARRPRRWLDAFDATLLPLVLGWTHLVGVWVLPRLGWPVRAWGGVELGAAGLLLAAAGRSGRRQGGATGAGLLAVGGAALLYAGFPAALGGVAAVALWAAAALGLAHLGQGWQSGGARLASYLLPAAGCAYAWFAPALAPGGASGIAAGLACGAAAAAAALQYVRQRRREVPARSWFFTRVDRRDDLGALPLLAAVGFGVLALRGVLHPLLAAFLAEPAAALSSVQSVALSLAALALVWDGQRRGDPPVRAVGVLVLAIAAVRVFGFELLASRGLPLVGSVLGFGLAVGGAALVLRRPVAGDALESGPGDA